LKRSPRRRQPALADAALDKALFPPADRHDFGDRTIAVSDGHGLAGRRTYSLDLFFRTLRLTVRISLN
jgi:hypothetical protein